MSNVRDAGRRPPLGIIVEGEGELASFRGLVASITGYNGLHVPIVNARGYGGVVQNLEEHLDDLVRKASPYGVLVCVDLRDCLSGGLFETCADLRAHVQGLIVDWVAARTGAPVFEPLPEAIRVVIQVQVFESWWLADPESLAALRSFQIDLDECSWVNVDEEVTNPVRWLKDRMRVPVNIKSPSLAREVMRGLHPAKARTLSPSFDKFYREVEDSVTAWLDAIAAA